MVRRGVAAASQSHFEKSKHVAEGQRAREFEDQNIGRRRLRGARCVKWSVLEHGEISVRKERRALITAV